MAALGIEMLIVACAAGGMNPNYRAGDLMVIEDHVNLSWDTRWSTRTPIPPRTTVPPSASPTIGR